MSYAASSSLIRVRYFGTDWQQGLKDLVLFDLPTFHYYFVEDNEEDHLVYDGDDPDRQPQ